MSEFPYLTAMIALPLVGALAIPLIPDKYGKNIRNYTLIISLLNFGLIVYGFWQNFTIGITDLQLQESYNWFPEIGLRWALGVDGISMPLIILSGLISTLAILASWQVQNKSKLYYFLLLVLSSAQIGVFAAQDLLLFFFMWELELVPVYILISIWGGNKRLYAATKFILYTALASIFILVSGLALAFYGDNFTLNITELGLKEYPQTLEILAYIGFLIAFGVKLPIFPFHTWLPDAHSEASAPVSMVLAGVLLKMGGYGLIRFNMEILPDANIYFAPLLVTLGVINIVYGAFTAFGQTNLKRRLASSSISHMGFVLIGIASFTDLGMNGAMLQMLSHGLIAAALFYLSGVAKERTHTLMMDEMGGLAKVMPKTFALFTIASMASLALPGMSGFVSELSVFLGIAQSDAYSATFKVVVTVLAGVGLILTPIYLLSMLRVVFYGKKENNLNLPSFGVDAQPREIFITVCLILPIIGIGLYPKMITNTYDSDTVQVASKVRSSLAIIAQQKVSHQSDVTLADTEVLYAPNIEQN
ncbi:MAG: NAD(P)H-quinone oxidoreductase subunit 4 [Cyanobacterium sp. T60_A2020_053]|nr:NAD(P)H-quinone oxidoreductase subunit 4 [Cyanobacterium sp. T60_A2020_053]